MVKAPTSIKTVPIPSKPRSATSKGGWHVSKSSMGMGDYYGTGQRQKQGTMRDSYTPGVNPLSKSKLKKPPKSLA